MNGPSESEKTWPATRAVRMPVQVSQRLVLIWGAHETEVTEKRPLVTVGRDERCSIVIKSDKVSRWHARIEYRNAHFSLTDRSSNCTYVTDIAGKTYKLSRETHVLMGAGTISFGIDPAASRANLYKYAVGP